MDSKLKQKIGCHGTVVKKNVSRASLVFLKEINFKSLTEKWQPHENHYLTSY
jgi:hypothetical protein